MSLRFWWLAKIRVAYETNYRPSYVPRSITLAHFSSERRGLYERIPLSFASVAVLVRFSNSSPVTSALPINDYDWETIYRLLVPFIDHTYISAYTIIDCALISQLPYPVHYSCTFSSSLCTKAWGTLHKCYDFQSLYYAELAELAETKPTNSWNNLEIERRVWLRELKWS